MEATVAEAPPPGVGSGNIGSSSLHLQTKNQIKYIFTSSPPPVGRAEADFYVGDDRSFVFCWEGGVVHVEAGVRVLTAVVMSALDVPNVRPTAVLGDQLGVVLVAVLIQPDKCQTVE